MTRVRFLARVVGPVFAPLVGLAFCVAAGCLIIFEGVILAGGFIAGLMMRAILLALITLLTLLPHRTSAEEPNACSVNEPDSVQISWNAPCLEGTWLLDTELGCRMWDWHPAPEDTATWSGACRGGAKVGYGAVQWFEHGRPIDRFEGTYIEGRRHGAGRYWWNETDWFVGFYVSDVPHGLGTASIAGEVFTGQWHRGCFKQGGRVVAIGVPRKSCEDNKYRIARDPVPLPPLSQSTDRPTARSHTY